MKSRYTGDTGLACALQYNPETGRLFEVHTEDTFDNEEIGFDIEADGLNPTKIWCIVAKDLDEGTCRF